MTAQEPQEGAAGALSPGCGAACPGHHRGSARPGWPTPARAAPQSRAAPAGPTPVPSRPAPLTLPAVGERGAAGRRGPAQAGRLGAQDEEAEGEHACGPAPRDTWHGAGGQLRAGRLSGPRHARAAAGAPDTAPLAQGLRGAEPVSGFCRRRKEGCGEGAVPARLGAAGVNAAGRTGPGRRGGRRGEAADGGCRPSPPCSAAHVRRWARQPSGRTARTARIPSPVSGRWSPLGPGRAPRSPAHALAEGPQRGVLEARGRLTRLPPPGDAAGGHGEGFPG